MNAWKDGGDRNTKADRPTMGSRCLIIESGWTKESQEKLLNVGLCTWDDHDRNNDPYFDGTHKVMWESTAAWCYLEDVVDRSLFDEPDEFDEPDGESPEVPEP